MLALIAFVAVAAQAPPADHTGIWEGAVGNLPVRACFVHREWGSFGAYYYLSQLRMIPLYAVEGSAGTFSEGPPEARNPRWRIQSADGTRLRARWTSNRRALPVRLTRVAASGGDDGPCSDLAFHQPRLEGVRTVASPVMADGVAYTRIALDHGGRFGSSVETFALAGTGEAVRRINASLGRMLAGSPPEWFDCVRSAMATSPNEGGFDESLTPALISQRWLGVNHVFDSYCGGNHPNHGLVYETYDLASGTGVDLHDWFTAAAVRRERLEGLEEGIKALEPALRSAILAGWTGDEECGPVVRNVEHWLIGLRRDAFVFAPDLPHVTQACAEEFTVPFERVRAFLTREGAANVDALR